MLDVWFVRCWGGRSKTRHGVKRSTVDSRTRSLALPPPPARVLPAQGRATGVEISTKKRDQDGLADLNDFYNDSDSDDAYDQFGDDDDGEEEEEKEEEG